MSLIAPEGGGVLKSYIRYHEVETLYKAWPTLEGILESLCVDLKQLKSVKGIDTQGEYIYSLTMRTRGYDDMPKGERLTDKTGELAVSYSDIMRHELKDVKHELKYEYFLIATVLDKLEIAYKRLAPLVRAILELYYWDNKTWEEIVSELEPQGQYISKSQAQRYRKAGVEKMRVILKVTVEDYNKIMELVDRQVGASG
jgi:hypothetical protein